MFIHRASRFHDSPSKKRQVAGRHVAMTPESSGSESESGEKDGGYWSTGLNKGSI